MLFTVYILRTSDNKLYIGQTGNPHARMKRLSAHDGALLLRSNADFKVVYIEEYPTRLEAVQREHQLKGWTRAKKEALILGDKELLRKL